MIVFIIASVTADGFIARDGSQSSLDWTSREDTQAFVRLTKEAGIMVMGSATFATIGRALPGRKTVVYTRHPEKLAGITDVEATDEAPAALVRRLAEAGYGRLAVCGGATIYRQFLDAGVVDEIYLTIEPVLFGAGVPLLDGMADTRLALVGHHLLNDDTLQVHYKVINPSPDPPR